MRRRLLSLLLPAALAGCPKAPPGTTPDRAGAGVNIPEGCEAPLGGAWLHADVPSWRYLGQDDGGTLVLAVSRTLPDGGTPPAPAGSGPRIELQRTAEGFRGHVVDTSFGPGDTPCTVTFPTEVLACTPDALTLSSASTSVVDEQCRPAPQTAPGRREVHRLVRPPPEPAAIPDGGTP